MADEGTMFYDPSSYMVPSPLNFIISLAWSLVISSIQGRPSSPACILTSSQTPPREGRPPPQALKKNLPQASGHPLPCLLKPLMTLPHQAWPFPSLSHSICLKNFLQLVITACFLLQESSAFSLIISGWPLQP